MNHSISQPSVNVDFIECDLASLSSITEAAKQVIQKYRSENFPMTVPISSLSSQLHVLICNAGVYMPAKKVTVDASLLP